MIIIIINWDCILISVLCLYIYCQAQMDFLWTFWGKIYWILRIQMLKHVQWTTSLLVAVHIKKKKNLQKYLIKKKN